MVLALNTIWNEGSYSIRVENHRDRYCVDIPPSQSEKFVGARWLDKGASKTVLSIVLDPEQNHTGGGSCHGRPIAAGKRTAVISLEDINWNLVLTGDVAGGEVRIPVNGNKDFDIVVRKDGTIALRCMGGAFTGENFQQLVSIPSLRLPPPTQAPSSSSPRVDSTCSQLDDPSGSTSSSPHHVDSVASSSSSSQYQPVPPNPPSSYSLAEISPELVSLLDELRADQRRILQKEFQRVGAGTGFAERLMTGGRRLIGAADPSEYLPMTALINALVIPLIFLFSYFLSTRRAPRRSSSSSPSRRRPPAAGELSRGEVGYAARRMIRERGEEMIALGMMHRLGGRVAVHRGEEDDDEAPPPYPEEEGRSLM